MTTAAFDTHKAARILTTAGFTNEQVEANIEVLMEVISNLATKDDIQSLRLATKQDTDSLHKDIEHLDQSFDLKLKALQNELTNSLTMRFIGIIGTGILFMKYLP